MINGTSLPALDIKTNINHSPHVVILGAGASVASSLRNPEKHGKILPSMPNLVKVLGLEALINSHGLSYEDQNFEDYYDELSQNGKYPELLKAIEIAVLDYFAELQLPDEATIYDYLILSLREKDIIATFNWDPFLGQAYVRNGQAIGFEKMPKIAFLHGNVGIGVCYKCKTCGWSTNECSKCSKQFSPSKLLYPVCKKDYSLDAFIKSQWDDVRNYIKNAYILTIFGYSAPKTDAEARKLMLSGWKENRCQDFAEIELIDIRAQYDRKSLEDNWREFFVREHYACLDQFFTNLLCRYPRRSCDAFAMMTLQCDPWPENKFPQNLGLSELHEWIIPLLREEEKGEFAKKPFN